MIKLILQLIDRIIGLIDKRQMRRIAELQETVEYKEAQEQARLKARDAAAIRGKYDHR